MKQLLLIIFAFWATIGNAQDTTNIALDTISSTVDTTELVLGKTKIIIIRDDEDKDAARNPPKHQTDKDRPKTRKKKHRNTRSMWSGLQLGVSSYSLLTGDQDKRNNNFLDLNHSKNRSVALNLISRRVDLGIPYVGLSTGIGIAFNRYALNRNVRLEYDADNVWGTLDTVNNFSKNYLNTTHITIPLLFELNTHKKASNGFRIAAGFEAGYLIGSRTKVKYKVNDKNQIDKSKGNFNMNAFRLNLIAMVGFKDISLYAKAAPTEFFTYGKGPQGYYHTSFGLLINFD